MSPEGIFCLCPISRSLQGVTPMKSTIFAIFAMVLSVLVPSAALGQTVGEVNDCKAEILVTNNLTEAQARELPIGFPIRYGDSMYPLAPGQNPWTLCENELLVGQTEADLRSELQFAEDQIAQANQDNERLASTVQELRNENLMLQTQNQALLDAEPEVIVQTIPEPYIPWWVWLIMGLLTLALLITYLVMKKQKKDALDRLRRRHAIDMDTAASDHARELQGVHIAHQETKQELARKEGEYEELDKQHQNLQERHHTLTEAHGQRCAENDTLIRQNDKLHEDLKVAKKKEKETDRILEAFRSGTPMWELTFHEDLMIGGTKPESITLIYAGRDDADNPKLRPAHGRDFSYRGESDLLRVLTTIPSLTELAYTRSNVDLEKLTRIRDEFERKVGRIKKMRIEKSNVIAKERLNEIFTSFPTPRDICFPIAHHRDFPPDTNPDPVKPTAELVALSAVR